MHLAPGVGLGHYELLAPIGTGGMGEVWRARDPRLDRTVAIKVLRRDAASASMRQRLEREAHVVAALSHPHICAIYDVGHAGDEIFLVMEHLAGETLADRMQRSTLSIDETLRIAIEIASALAAAHRAGIVHRDLKPGNVMLTRSGVKLLDFGLARITTPPLDSISNASTSEKPITAEGTIVGTVPYMSPEQVEGKELDARTDLFSFGSLLYEMLTGKRAFEGASQASIIAGILQSEPPALLALRPIVPATLDRLVKSCLVKDRDARWQSAGDLETTLRWIAGGVEPASIVTKKNRWMWMVLGVAAIAILVAAWALRPRTQPIPARFAVYPEGRGAFGGSPVTSWFALSPDGKKLAFAASGEDRQRRLWIRSLDAVEAIPIAGTEGAESPFWSHDGKDIGFFSGRTMKRVALDGGSPRTICEKGGGTATWGANDTIVFAAWNEPVGLYRVSAAGGIPTVFTRPDRKKNEAWHYWPAFLPDGERVLFLRFYEGGHPELCVASMDDGEVRTIAPASSRVEYVRPGRLLFVKGRTLVTQRFDHGTLRLEGEPAIVSGQMRNLIATGEAPFSASLDGRVLAFQVGAPLSKLVWHDRSGAQRDATDQVRSYESFRLSRDGKRVVTSILDPETSLADLWLLHLERNVAARLTSTTEDERTPVWTGDERQIVFRSHNPDKLTAVNMFIMPERGGAATHVFDRPGLHLPRDAFGRLVLFTMFDSKAYDLAVLHLDTRKLEPFAKSPANETDARFAPDGKWIAYVSDDSGRNEVHVEPYPATGDKWRVSAAGGTAPRWSADGRELFYLAPDKTLMSARVNLPAGFSTPQPLFRNADILGYTAAPDGRFLMNVAVVDEKKLPLTVAIDWQ